MRVRYKSLKQPPILRDPLIAHGTPPLPFDIDDYMFLNGEILRNRVDLLQLQDELAQEKARNRKLEEILHDRIDGLWAGVRIIDELTVALQRKVFPGMNEGFNRIAELFRYDGSNTTHLDERRSFRLPDEEKNSYGKRKNYKVK